MINEKLYYKRQIELWGDQKQENLKDKSILIIGSGGLGSSLAISLGNSGIGYIDIIDFDTVAYHNIHRQTVFTLDDINRYKSEVLKEFILERNQFLTIENFISTFEDFTFTKKYDLILDATDNLQTRQKIDNISKKINTPWIYGSVEEFHGQVCFFDKAQFNSIFNISNHTPKGIAAPIVHHIASLQANLAIRYLVDLPVKKDFLYYCFFDNDGIYQTQKFGLPI